MIRGLVHTHRFARVLPPFLIAMLMWSPAPAVGAIPGDLDPTFGEGGRVVTGFDGSIDDTPYYEMDGLFGRAYGVAVQADGKIVAAGVASEPMTFAIARHLPSGALDTMFGGTGVVTTTFAHPSVGYAIAIQADGQIVVVGTVGRHAFGGYSGTPGEAGNSFALARYSADGGLDPSFGGDGMVRTRFGSVAAAASAVAIQADGKLVVAGSAGRRVALARYQPDGSLDTSFSVDGKIRSTFLNRPGRQSASDVGLQADGRILLSGVACDETRCEMALARYLPDGTPDVTFGGGGVVLAPMKGYEVGDLALQADGKIVVGAWHRLFRFDPDGALDPTFADGGTVRTAVAADGVVLQSDGKIVVTGPTMWEPYTFALARFDTAGALDRSFGEDGRAVASFPGFDNMAYALAIQADGKIVAAGTTADFNIDGKFALARFLPT